MNYEEIIIRLEQKGISARYRQFSEEPKLPFAVILKIQSRGESADDRNLYFDEQWMLELYTEEKSFEAESKVEKILDDLEIVYESEEGYIESERMYLVRYEFGGIRIGQE